MPLRRNASRISTNSRVSLKSSVRKECFINMDLRECSLRSFAIDEQDERRDLSVTADTQLAV